MLNTYDGWTNKATAQANLLIENDEDWVNRAEEIVRDINDVERHHVAVSLLATCLKDELCGPTVNWEEIAEQLISLCPFFRLTARCAYRTM